MRSTEPKHMLQLDGLRAFAVFFVLIAHYHPRDHFMYTKVPWGELGVHLFFVLSGFLITSILLRCRQLVETNQQSSAGALRQFYIRRFLRIFPLYYATLAVLALFNYPDVRASLGWHYAYLSNFYFVYTNSGHGRIAHFWTLAVEEQFYLTWPCLVLFVPRRRLLPLTVALIAAAPLFRLAVSLVLPPQYYLARLWLPFASIDTLGFGALLAMLSNRESSWARYRDPALKLAGWIGLPALALYLVLYAPPGHWFPKGVDIVLERSVMGLAFFWLIGRAARGFSGPLGRFFSWTPFVYVGKISYGIYVVHFFTPEIVEWACAQVGLPLTPLLPVRFVIFSTVTVLIASVSWYCFEKPLNDLKRYFEYEKTPTQPRKAEAGVGVSILALDLSRQAVRPTSSTTDCGEPIKLDSPSR